MTVIHTIMDALPLKLHTTVKEDLSNLEKKLYTVSVYAHGLTKLVRVKFDQTVYLSNNSCLKAIDENYFYVINCFVCFIFSYSIGSRTF